ncbi:hypothetical protein BDC45DRAFT_539942 [Circinella umbellata]|nr:hypothetical protein BDC45DRAFT_539942 [Circinella umbellata]
MDPTSRSETLFTPPTRSVTTTHTATPSLTDQNTVQSVPQVVNTEQPIRPSRHNSHSFGSPMALDHIGELHSILDQDELLQQFLALKARYNKTVDFCEWGRT